MKNNDKGNIPLTFDEYNDLFCSNDEILEKAYERVWETRNFEIDKFWLRTAFFWGFIAMIFGGYVIIMTSDNSDKLISMNFDIYLILLGIVFSVAWLLVIFGSKNWQENWEAHIDMLEDKVSGPLYKTIYCSSIPYYSVSKINIFLSVLIIVVWIIILIQNLFFIKSLERSNCYIILALSTSIIVIILLLILCRSAKGKWKIKKSIRKQLKDKNYNGPYTRFLDRWEIE